MVAAPDMELGTDLASWRYADPTRLLSGWAAQALRATIRLRRRRITDYMVVGSYTFGGAYFRDEVRSSPPEGDGGRGL
jgi:hypothetical protein